MRRNQSYIFSGLIFCLLSSSAIFAGTVPASRKEALEARMQQRFQDAAELFLRGCQQGDGESCHGYAYEMERIYLLTRAVNYYRIACNKGIVRSCNNAGWAAERRKKYELAKGYYDRACSSHHKNACSRMLVTMKKAVFETPQNVNVVEETAPVIEVPITNPATEGPQPELEPVEKKGFDYWRTLKAKKAH